MGIHLQNPGTSDTGKVFRTAGGLRKLRCFKRAQRVSQEYAVWLLPA
jgi:hypothetical protein